MREDRRNSYLLISVFLLTAMLLTGCTNSRPMQNPTESGTDVGETQGKPGNDDGTGNGTENQGNAGSENQDDADTEQGNGDSNGMENVPFEPITMTFVGDVHLSDKLYANYEKSGITGFLSQKLWDNFRESDLMILNHEYVATDLPESEKDTNQLYNYKAPTAYNKLLQEMGVDIVSLANNHAMDYGEQSLFDTIETLDELGIGHVGAGENLDAAKAAEIREINGKKIAILGASRFILNWQWYAQTNKPGVMTTYESTDRFQMVKDEIARLKEEEGCDIVAVYVHFGKDKIHEFNESQQNISHAYIDAGADLVVGSHAHTLQGIEIYKGAPIYYNLGNFLFERYAVDTMAVNITIHEDNSITTQIVPCRSEKYKAVDVTGEKAQEIFDLVKSISVNIEIDEEGNVTETTPRH